MSSNDVSEQKRSRLYSCKLAILLIFLIPVRYFQFYNWYWRIVSLLKSQQFLLYICRLLCSQSPWPYGFQIFLFFVSNGDVEQIGELFCPTDFDFPLHYQYVTSLAFMLYGLSVFHFRFE